MKHYLFAAILVIVVIASAIYVWNGETRPGVPNVVIVATSTKTTNPPRSYEYDINLPNALILVDPQGRRTGRDPISGAFYHEIPGTGYGGVEHSGQLAVSGLPDGQYKLYVLGGVTGSYWVDAFPPQKITGNIHAGEMDIYSLDFSSTSPEDPKLVFQGTVSSTASITTAPPNNLPKL